MSQKVKEIKNKVKRLRATTFDTHTEYEVEVTFDNDDVYYWSGNFLIVMGGLFVQLYTFTKEEFNSNFYSVDKELVASIIKLYENIGKGCANVPVDGFGDIDLLTKEEADKLLQKYPKTKSGEEYFNWFINKND